MPQRTLLITDFFSKCHSTTVSNATLFEKPIKVIKVEEQSIIKHEIFETNLDQCTPNPPLETISSPSENHEIIKSEENDMSNQLFQNSPSKSSIPSRIKFVRHHSAPLHHRSPVKMRERPMEQQDLEEMRTRIRAFRNDLYKYKSTYSRSPIKRPNIIGAGDLITSPFKHPAPQTPTKRYENQMNNFH